VDAETARPESWWPVEVGPYGLKAGQDVGHAATDGGQIAGDPMGGVERSEAVQVLGSSVDHLHAIGTVSVDIDQAGHHDDVGGIDLPVRSGFAALRRAPRR
jgi:hypothetical protein